MRTVAGGRNEYSPGDAAKFLEKWFDRDRAIRIVAIARKYGIKAEAIPKGMVALRTSGSRFTIEVDD